MNTISLKLAAVALVGLSLSACSNWNQCMQPDPLEPAHGVVNHGVDRGTGTDRVPPYAGNVK